MPHPDSAVGMSSGSCCSPKPWLPPAQHCDCCSTGPSLQLAWDRCCAHFVLSYGPFPSQKMLPSHFI